MAVPPFCEPALPAGVDLQTGRTSDTVVVCIFGGGGRRQVSFVFGVLSARSWAQQQGFLALAVTWLIFTLWVFLPLADISDECRLMMRKINLLRFISPENHSHIHALYTGLSMLNDGQGASSPPLSNCFFTSLAHAPVRCWRRCHK